LNIVVGLGNPGARYRETRHNLGFRAAEAFARRLGLSWDETICRCLSARGAAGGREILLAKPQDWMNRSGEAVRCLLERCAATPADLIVLCDDAALDLGTLRIREGGSDGGHRGLRSIGASLGTDRFGRLRLGIRTPELLLDDLAEHVLAPFRREDRERMDAVLARACECLAVALEEGIPAAMNRFNRRQPARPAGSAPPAEP
jgi:PTH1 family peptidyl-tRNA hydrolase